MQFILCHKHLVDGISTTGLKGQKEFDMLTPDKLVCEYYVNPIGLDVRQPRLSWQVSAEQRGAQQTAYQILVGKNPAALEDAAADVLWDTGKVMSDN